MDPATTHFASRKLHSLLGVIPLGAFILEHLYTNAFVLGGQHAYDKQVDFLLSLPKPVLYSLEIVFIALPLLFHGILGIKIAIEGKSNARNYRYSRNLSYTLQRWAGMYLFVFVIYHVWTTRFSGHFTYPVHDAGLVTAGGPLIASKSSIYYFMLSHLSGNWFLGLVYFLGVLAAAYHFANGLWTFCISWGITVGAGAQRVSKVIFNVLGLLLLGLGTASVIHLVTTPDPFAG